MSESDESGAGDGVIPGMPNVPVLRHLTWREAHLFELGVYAGVGAAVMARGELWGAAATVFMGLRRRLQSDDQHRDADDLVRGYVRDAWYAGMGFVLAFAATYALLTLS